MSLLSAIFLVSVLHPILIVIGVKLFPKSSYWEFQRATYYSYFRNVDLMFKDKSAATHVRKEVLKRSLFMTAFTSFIVLVVMPDLPLVALLLVMFLINLVCQTVQTLLIWSRSETLIKALS